MGRKILALLTVVLLAAVFVAGCGGSNTGGQSSGGQKFINIATGGTSGTYYPLGGALAEIWNKNIQGANATAQSTGASVANVNLLKDGKAEVIFVQNDIAYYTYNGTEMFKDNKYEDIRGLATLYPETIQIVTRADKGIKAIADLKGKKVAVGAAGSGTETNARQILEAAGITYNDIQVQYLSFSEAANNLKDGNIDAAFVTAGYPTAAIQDIAAQHKIVLIPLDDKTVETLISKYPFYTRTVIPANTYSGQTEDVVAVSVKAMLAVSAKYDEDMAYQMVKTMYENQERLKAAHKNGELITPDTGKEGMSIPLHPGAEKYFKEIGK
ncbi:TAXI family TRAP transporter solute-binding subunit [Thermosediminibacter litoriperuensis]|uniref:TRAP transporter TAXI family solute receptor n=1 Tax=Thermosediminibacter litoriperuensis TaxID=291989 RepID=A0A5S5AKT6_9FIRM|nr:TAXI family TRAP transporter solute-binding subunit [Thermosediminibacter litoriperuensis]TYP50900.1 hypothetical protein LZ11_01955 [Thermosediminibacter litoriperuensis]